MNKGFDLNGRVAIVTGGKGGAGLGMARGLSAPAPAWGFRLPSITT
jgi:NAD(P)-dependent dehydrogenase (short-subunit alcohol dehydrogenase family)